jgi:hypothetical protein
LRSFNRFALSSGAIERKAGRVAARGRETRGKTRTYRVAGRGGHDNRDFAGGCPGDLSNALPSVSDDNIDWQSDQIGSYLWQADHSGFSGGYLSNPQIEAFDGHRWNSPPKN